MAVLLTWALFLGWTAIGLAILNAAGLRNGTRKLLLAPALGAVPPTVLAYTGLKLGFPVRESGTVIGIGLALLTVVALWLTRGPRSRVVVTVRRQLPFAGVLVAAFALTAWPMFKFGFDWVANGNDDFANYCLAATGFREHGYRSEPTAAVLLAKQDLTQPLWYTYFDSDSPRETRCGSELTLALISVWTGFAPQQAFMPVIIAFNLTLVSAAAGMVLAFTRRRWVAVWTAVLLTVSSQTAYGLVQQLIAQALGLALLCVSLTLLRLPVRAIPRGPLARRAAACGLAFAGLALFYAEVVPFLVAGAVLLGIRDLARRVPVRKHVWYASASIGVMVLVLPLYLVGLVDFILFQVGHGTSDSSALVELFPFYLTPRAPALVSGLLPLYANLPEPAHSAVLALGVGMFVVLAGVAVQQYRRGRPFGAVLVVMFVLGALFVRQSAVFGLFKLVMFAQPFACAALVVWAAQQRRGARLGALAALVLVGTLNVGTQAWYLRQSTGHDARVDVPVATQKRVLSTFRAELATARSTGPVERVVLVTENMVLQKLFAAEVSALPNTQLAMAPYFRVEVSDAQNGLGRDTSRGALIVFPERNGLPAVRDPKTDAVLHRFAHEPADRFHEDPTRVLFVAGVGSLSVFNRVRFPETGPALYCAPLAEVRNFVAFRDATGARQTVLGMGTIGEVALSRLEPDPALRHRTFAAVGRAVVVDVVNPTPVVRAVVSYTGTYLPEPEQRTVPNIEIVGGARVPLGGTGIGCARLVSPPVAPQHVGSANVLVLDVNKAQARNPNRLSGLDALWGGDLPRDRRQISGHLREFSVVSEEEYSAFRPPERLANFPADLGHPHVEYSGVMEDGWLGREFKARLTCGGTNRDLVVRGQVPGIDPNFRTTVTVLLDGSPVLSRELPAGDFELRAPAGTGAGPKWVDLRFDRTTLLPKPDGRTVSALLRHVGFEQTQTEGTARR